MSSLLGAFDLLSIQYLLWTQKAGDLSTKAGERETRQKGVSLRPKAGELASLSLPVCRISINFVHDVKMVGNNENSSGEEFKTE